MKKRRLRAKLHNAFLWIMFYLSYAVFLVSAGAMDSDSWIPVIALLASVTWLYVFAKANEGRW
jgi:CHASE2 domain-containing sensor protein